MSDGKQARQRLRYGLIAAGILIVLAAGGCLGRSQLLGSQPPTASRATPAAGETSAPAASVIAPVTLLPATPMPEPSQAGLQSTQPAPAASPALTPATTALPATTAPQATTAPLAATATPGPTAASSSASAPVRLTIPDLKIDVPVVEMTWRVVQTATGPRSDWVIPENEAGHHINSASLGEQGNLVISGHNNIFGQVFKPISFAWDNDTRTQVDSFTDRSDVLTGRNLQLFDAAGQRFDYVIRDFYRLKDTGVSAQQRIANGRFMAPTDQAQVTVITCWPPTSNTHRLVLIAVPAN